MEALPFVMPGLNPGIQPGRLVTSKGGLDCRAKPGNDKGCAIFGIAAPDMSRPQHKNAHFISLANTVSFTTGSSLSMFSLVTTRIGTEISFSTVPPASLASRASPDFWPIR